jgi:hypothetical protein
MVMVMVMIMFMVMGLIKDLNIPIILKTGLGGLGAAAGLPPAGAVELEESAIVNRKVAIAHSFGDFQDLTNFGESRSIPKKVSGPG